MSAAGGRPSWWMVPLWPWIGLVRPARAARAMASASRPAFVCTFLFYLFLWPAAIILITMWDATLFQHWVRPPNWGYTTLTTSPASAPASRPVFNPGEFEVRRRGMAEVWADWHAHGPLGQAEFMFGLLTLAGLAAWAFYAWLHLPTLHGTGSPAASYRVALRALGSAWAPLIAASVVVGLVIVAAHHAQLTGRGTSSRYPQWLFIILPLGLITGVSALLYWVSVLMRGVVSDGRDADRTPRCEACGYNLTHVPQDGRCPECAAVAALSLRPELARSGAAWEASVGWRRVQCWFTTNRELLFSPTMFYRRLQVRADPVPAERFARRHLTALFLGTGAMFMTLATTGSALPGIGRDEIQVFNWLCFALLILIALAGVLGGFSVFGLVGLLAAGSVFLLSPLYENPMLHPEGPPIILLVMFGLTAAGHLVHRVIGALVTTLWFIGGHLSDPRAARKVLAYEAVYLWVPWLYGVLVAAVNILFEDQIRQLLWRRSFAGAPLEGLLFFGGLMAIGLFWLYRYRLIGRAVRWANF